MLEAGAKLREVEHGQLCDRAVAAVAQVAACQAKMSEFAGELMQERHGHQMLVEKHAALDAEHKALAATHREASANALKLEKLQLKTQKDLDAARQQISKLETRRGDLQKQIDEAERLREQALSIPRPIEDELATAKRGLAVAKKLFETAKAEALKEDQKRDEQDAATAQIAELRKALQHANQQIESAKRQGPAKGKVASVFEGL